MGLGISSNMFVPASLIFDNRSLHLYLDYVMSVLTQINFQPLNLITINCCKVCSTPVLQQKNRKKLGALSTNCCINKFVDLAMQSGWDHEDARKKFVEGYVCLTCYRTVEKCSSLKSLLIAKLSERANDPTTLESSGTKRKAMPTEHAAAVKVVSLSASIYTVRI